MQPVSAIISSNPYYSSLFFPEIKWVQSATSRVLLHGQNRIFRCHFRSPGLPLALLILLFLCSPPNPPRLIKRSNALHPPGGFRCLAHWHSEGEAACQQGILSSPADVRWSLSVWKQQLSVGWFLPEGWFFFINYCTSCGAIVVLTDRSLPCRWCTWRFGILGLKCFNFPPRCHLEELTSVLVVGVFSPRNLHLRTTRVYIYIYIYML